MMLSSFNLPDRGKPVGFGVDGKNGDSGGASGKYLIHSSFDYSTVQMHVGLL